MKRLMLLATIAAGFSAMGQTPKVDSANGLLYVNIAPVKWQHNKPICERLYGYTLYDNMSSAATIAGRAGHLPAPDTHPVLMDIQRYSLTLPEYDSLRVYGSVYLFTYLARQMELNITE